MTSVICDDDRSFDVDPSHTALIAIDFQRDFIDPQGMAGVLGEDVSLLQAILPAASRTLAAARNAGLSLIHTREGYQPDLSDVHPIKRERNGAGTPGPLGRFLIRGEFGHDFIDGFQSLAGEAVFDKAGFGAFYRTDLERHLRDAGITHLVLMGVTTQCCVQSTLREAVDRGFYCLLLEDCCAAYDPAIHAASFLIIRGEGNLFGWISDSRAFCKAIA